MLDYQRIIDDVRTSLLPANAKKFGFLRSASVAYLAACEEANERLRRCGALLRQGQRSEALRLSNAEPALLDVVAALILPERDQWVALLNACGAEPPPPLLLNLAAELNQAAVRERPLVALLAQHRKLALSQSALIDRIEVLRQIAALDADNPIWRGDLADYERERHKQLEAEVAAATSAGDVATLTTLCQELRSSPWIVPPPSPLAGQAAASRALLRRRQALVELEPLAGELNDAFGSYDLQSGHSLRARWNELVGAARLSNGDPLLERAAPALEWLDEEDRRRERDTAHQDAILALQSALDRQRPREILQRAHKSLKHLGHEVPGELEARYRARLDEIDRAAARRTRRRTVSLVAGALLAFGGAALAYHWWKEHSIDARQFNTLAHLMEQGKLDEAQDFIALLHEQKSPALHSPRMAGLLADLHQREHEETDRRAAFSAALAQVEAAGVEDPDLESLARVESLARTQAERTEAIAARKKIDLAQSEKRRDRDGEFKASLAALERRIAALDNARAETASADDIDALRGELAKLTQRSTNISPDLLDEWRPLEAQIDRLAGAARAQRDLTASEAAITAAVGDRDKFREALAGYVKGFPNSARTKSFKRVMAEPDLWAEVDAWNAFLERWRKSATGELSPVTAAEFLKAIRDFCEAHPHWATVTQLQQRLPGLEAIVRRVDDEQHPIRDSLEKLFHDRLVSSSWLVETKEFHRYYSFHRPVVAANGSTQIRYLLDFDLAERTLVIKPGGLREKPAPAPQSAVAAKIDPLLTRMSDETWETSILDMLHELCRPDAAATPIDPLLRLHLVQKTLEVGCQGSYPLTASLEPQLQTLRESQVSPIVNWLDPESTEAEAARPIARRELEAIGDPSSARPAVLKRLEAAHAPLGKRLEWMGWLRSGPKQNWECASRATPSRSGRLFVLASAGENHILSPIGHAANGEFVIDAASDSLVEGRPVYLAD